MTTVAGRFSPAILGTVLALLTCGGSFAQDVRVNPFLPSATEEERRILADKERMRQAIREMMPEIKTMLMPVFEEQRATMVEELAAAAPVAEEGVTGAVPDPSAALAGVPAGIPAVATIPGTMIPATAQFVACLNGKAMYRDANGTKYFNENASTVCPD